MAKNAKQTQSAADHEQAKRVANIFASSEFVEIIESRWRFAWLNFRAGFYRGVGGVVGVALVVVLIGYLVTIFGGLPYIGDFVKDVQGNVPTTSTSK